MFGVQDRRNVAGHGVLVGRWIVAVLLHSDDRSFRDVVFPAQLPIVAG